MTTTLDRSRTTSGIGICGARLLQVVWRQIGLRTSDRHCPVDSGDNLAIKQISHTAFTLWCASVLSGGTYGEACPKNSVAFLRTSVAPASSVAFSR
jgi:hypothetical protein